MNVVPERQREILALADQAGDTSAAFIRAQVLRTPATQRQKGPSKRTPWNQGDETRKKLVDRLAGC